MFSAAFVAVALLASAIAQQCPDGRPPFGPCTPDCPPGFVCDPTIQQCCPTANTTSSTTSPIVIPTRPPNPLPLPTANPATSCKDKVNPRTGVSECRQRVGLCDVPIYFTVMTEQCPSTCKRCPGTFTSSTLPSGAACVDLVNPMSNASDCPFRTAQCQDPVYRDVMMKQCPKTCGFCTPNPSVVTTIRPIMRNPAVPQLAMKLMKNPFSFGKMVQKKFREPLDAPHTLQDFFGNGMR
ncbi:hypothetical protein Y032_0004g2213 [Ancylostoma ceylanicum]|nr:hypothetical protein Y032_0004g2213 [Ancylostoma ceylanicum]